MLSHLLCKVNVILYPKMDFEITKCSYGILNSCSNTSILHKKNKRRQTNKIRVYVTNTLTTWERMIQLYLNNNYVKKKSKWIKIPADISIQIMASYLLHSWQTLRSNSKEQMNLGNKRYWHCHQVRESQARLDLTLLCSSFFFVISI